MLSSNDLQLRDQIAAVAARFIAEDGLDYAGAKERAVREVIGSSSRGHAGCVPDNAHVVAAVREHQALFMADTQPARLAHLRRTARDVMRFLEAAGLGVDLVVQGAIVNGTAGEHSDIHLVAFNDNAKDLEIFLINAGVEFDVSETSGPRPAETIAFLWPQRRVSPSPRGMQTEPEGVHLAMCDPRDRRVASSIERADLAALERLIDAEST